MSSTMISFNVGSKMADEQAITSSLFSGYKYKTCDHCGEKGSRTELFCDCELLIVTFGKIGCTGCGIWYGQFQSYKEYMDIWGPNDTYDYYESELHYWMKPPCGLCAPCYCDEFNAKLEPFLEWKKKNTWRFEERYEDDYDEPCRSNRGMCPCCGDCP